MTMEFRTDKIASRFLGKQISGSELYDSSLLVPIPRAENRQQYNIDSANLPFDGCDVWHAYEFSALTNNGLPVTRLIKLKYSCESEFLVESKSLKLYFNSFNMSRFGDNIAECLSVCKRIIETDLSNALKTNVQINFIENDSERVEIFNNFENILNFVDETSLKIEKFSEAPELLFCNTCNEVKTHYLTFDSLRSNCRVTHQPDFGEIFIYYKSDKHIDEASLIKYLCSFRSEYHFHEECCEMIYKRLYDLLKIDENKDELFVCILYTRRGGIDICPVRYSKNCAVLDSEILCDVFKYARKSIRQ